MTMLALAACGDALDTSRSHNEAPSLGASLYEEVCHRVAHAEHPKDVSGHRTYQTCRYGAAAPSTAGLSLLALTAERERFITAVDKAIDPSMTDALRQLLTDMLPLYDDNTMQAHVAAISDAVTAAAQSPEALKALGRLAARRGYVQPHAHFAHAWLSYDRLDALTRRLFETPAAQNMEALQLLQQNLAEQMREAPEQWLSDNVDDVAAWSQFLLSALKTSSTSPTPRWIVRRDSRGIAMPVMAGHKFQAPFIDRDGDGLADVDQHGRFIGLDGLPISKLPTPFPIAKGQDAALRTPHARALRDDGALWYQYRDAAPSVWAGLLDQARLLLAEEPNAALSAAQLVQASMGTPAPQMYTGAEGRQIDFVGFDAAASPWIDVAQSLFELGQSPLLVDALTHVLHLWDFSETSWAQLADLVWELDRVRRADPKLYARRLETPSSWVQDFVTLGTQIAAEPGLIEDLIAALAEPAMAQLGARLAEQMRHTDRIDFDFDDVNAPVVGDYKTPVDTQAPDVAYNQSIFERLLHLVHDASGQRVCSAALDFSPDYAPCELFDIEDAAIFYVRAMVGKATLVLRVKADDEFVSSQLEGAHQSDALAAHSEMESFSGIDGFAKIDNLHIGIAGLDDAGQDLESHARYRTFSVTPQAAARLLFSMYDERVSSDSPYSEVRPGLQMLTPRLRIEGAPFDQVHYGTLFAWEKNQFFEAVRPLVQAFAKHDREDLLVRLVSTLHTHWQSPKSDTTQHQDPTRPNYAQQTGLSRLEPLLAYALDDGDVLGRLGALVRASLHMPHENGRCGVAVIAALLEQALRQAPQGGVAIRQMPEGAPQLESPVPLALLARGVGDMAAHITGLLPAETLAPQLLYKALKQSLEVETIQGEMRFANRQAHALTTAWLRFAQARLRQSPSDADAVDTLGRVTQLRDALASTPLQLGLGLVAQLASDEAFAAEVGRLGLHLLGPRMDATLEASSDALQVLGDTANLAPLLQQLGLWLTPKTGLVGQSMHVLRMLQQVDKAHAMPQLLQGFVRDMGDETPLAALIDIFGRVNRQMPGADDTLVADDFAALLAVVNHLLTSPEHGFVRLVQLVQSRHQGSEAAP